MSLNSIRDSLPSVSSLKQAVGMASSLPRTYKAAVFEKKGEPLVFKDVDLKEPGEGEILIKVEANGICRSDEAVQNEQMGPLPRIPGHEMIGKVVAVGPNEKKWKAGDRAGGGWHGGHDGICKPCQKSQFQCCVNEQINGVTRDGGYAEYCTLRSEAAVRIPNDVPAEDYAPLLCAGVTTYNSMRNQNIQAGEIVAIQGLGGLGHLALQYAAKMGFHVVALSRDGSKEKFARDLGAMDYIDQSKVSAAEALQKMGGAAMIVTTAPNPTIFDSLIGGLAPFGKLLLLAVAGEATFNTIPMITGGRTVTAWPSGQQHDSEDTIEFSQKQKVSCMTEKFPFAKANEAYEHMMSGKVRFRSVLVMD